MMSLPFTVLQEQDYSRNMSQVEQELAAMAHSGEYTTFDGGELCYEYYLADNSKAFMIVVHGFTEFAEKYRELAWYFHQAGYSVLLYDQRGHGHSFRAVENPRYTHVDSFDDYERDLEGIINDVVRPVSKDQPLYLFSHSMGCAEALLYMEKHPCAINRAVLSSPMILPVFRGFPKWLLELLLNRYGAIDGWNSKIRIFGEFDPNPAFEDSMDRSRARFEYNLKKRKNDPMYQGCAPTYAWMRSAMRLPSMVFTKALKAIQTQVIVFSGGKDSVVRTDLHKKLAKELSHCRFVYMPEAYHTMFNAAEPLLSEYLETTFDFLAR